MIQSLDKICPPESNIQNDEIEEEKENLLTKNYRTGPIRHQIWSRSKISTNILIQLFHKL